MLWNQIAVKMFSIPFERLVTCRFIQFNARSCWGKPDSVKLSRSGQTRSHIEKPQEFPVASKATAQWNNLKRINRARAVNKNAYAALTIDGPLHLAPQLTAKQCTAIGSKNVKRYTEQNAKKNHKSNRYGEMKSDACEWLMKRRLLSTRARERRYIRVCVCVTWGNGTLPLHTSLLSCQPT